LDNGTSNENIGRVIGYRSRIT